MTQPVEKVDKHRSLTTTLERFIHWVKSVQHQIGLWFSQDPGELSEQEQKNVDAKLNLALAKKFRGGIAKSTQFSLYASGEDLSNLSNQKISTVFYQMDKIEEINIDALFKQEFNRPLTEFFLEFEQKPIGAASLSQVHRAKTFDGQTVAVKIQYPNLSTYLPIDLESSITKLLGGVDSNLLSQETLVTFKQGILSELDYAKEAQEITAFSKYFQSVKRWSFPIPLPQLSSLRILTTRYIDGLPIPEFLKQNPSKNTKNLIAKDLLSFGLLSNLMIGKFNADPNPGNFLISTQNDSYAIGFIDFGLTIAIDKQMIESDRMLFFSLIKSDAEMFRFSLHKSELVQKAAVFQSSQYRKFELLFSRFFTEEDFICSSHYANEITLLFWNLVKTGQFNLSKRNIFLWRHRIAVFNLLGMLESKPNGYQVIREIFKQIQ